jgi:hypothetical protein
MPKKALLELLHKMIREKDKEYHDLLEILQYNSPSGAELFSLKRKIIVLTYEKSFLIQQAKDLNI